MLATDPALRFWLRYVQGKGALADDSLPTDGTTLVVLPRQLQADLGLPEEIVVTADPEVAREDGAMLLAPGSPALDLATSGVLAAGDVGRVALAWPTSVAPGADVLEARARDLLPVDHGRIDLRSEPCSSFRPVLRVGALLTFALSLDDRFQERAECWVDVPSAVELAADPRRRLAAWPRGASPASARWPAGLRAALAEAHRLIDERAAARQLVLARHAGRGQEAELARTRAYYEEALASIGQRQATAPPERRELLDARAEATRAERGRRLAEIEEKHRPRREIRPFRLHLVLVPTLSLPVEVRRGPRRYPLALDWLLPAGVFAPVRCPSCAATNPLVAGKQRLGCSACAGGAAATGGRGS
jgi:hypothetical protein